jgi:hypothetical protein
MTISRRNTAVWGDGFVNDGWWEMAAVKDWAAVSTDEYVRLFPALVPRDGRIPESLYRHVQEKVASRAVQLQNSEKRSGIDRHAESIAKARAEEGAAIRFLSDILYLAGNDSLASADTTAAAATTFGYLTCVHPAYLWPFAVVSHERETTAAWLGVVGGGRAALMPIEVAEYLLDVIECRDGQPAKARDSQIAGMIAQSASLDELWRAARQRCLGNSMIVRRRRGATQIDVRRLVHHGVERLKSACSATFSAGARLP